MKRNFGRLIFKALIKKVDNEGIKIDDNNIPIIRATADEITKRLVAHNMQFIVEAELSVSNRYKRGIWMLFAQVLNFGIKC